MIYNTHELIRAVKPKVYFECKGENKTNFPDVKEKNVRYNFNGQKSWQVRKIFAISISFQ